jgi:hypothetical protein
VFLYREREREREKLGQHGEEHKSINNNNDNNRFFFYTRTEANNDERSDDDDFSTLHTSKATPEPKQGHLFGRCERPGAVAHG